MPSEAGGVPSEEGVLAGFRAGCANFGLFSVPMLRHSFDLPAFPSAVCKELTLEALPGTLTPSSAKLSCRVEEVVTSVKGVVSSVDITEEFSFRLEVVVCVSPGKTATGAHLRVSS